MKLIGKYIQKFISSRLNSTSKDKIELHSNLEQKRNKCVFNVD